MGEKPLRSFLGDFVALPGNPIVQKIISSYGCRLANQVAKPSEFALSEADAARGLCLQSFHGVLTDLEEQMPPGFMRGLASSRHFLCGGDAALLARAMKGLCPKEKRCVWAR